MVFDVMHVMLVFGERYMTRTVAECARRSDDAEIKTVARAFVVQETEHAQAHKAFWPEIEARYDTTTLLRFFAWITAALERLPLTLRLAITLAIEHNTATFAEVVLEHRVLDGVDAAPRRALEWHCAEEIEHQHAVFMILDDAIGGRFTRWFWRQLGMACALPLLCTAQAVGFMLLWRQRREPAVLNDLCALFLTDEALISKGLMRGLRFMLPSFEPRLTEHTRALAEHALTRRLTFPALRAATTDV